VIDACSYRDEDDDCTYYYTVDYPQNKTDRELEVQVLKKKGINNSADIFVHMSGLSNMRHGGRMRPAS